MNSRRFKSKSVSDADNKTVLVVLKDLVSMIETHKCPICGGHVNLIADDPLNGVVCDNCMLVYAFIVEVSGPEGVLEQVKR